MKKYKILGLLLFLILFTSFYGVAYSFFNSNANIETEEIGIAKFIFNTEISDEFQLSLNNLVPGDIQEYTFSVNNIEADSKSDVSIDYQIQLKTYHLIPLEFELYKIIEEEEALILTCNEEFERDEQGEITCGSPLQEMIYSSESIDDYKLKVIFPSEYEEPTYSNLVDYLNVEIKSWQKTGE